MSRQTTESDEWSNGALVEPKRPEHKAAPMLLALSEAKFRCLDRVDVGRHGYPLIPDLGIGAYSASKVESGGDWSHILCYISLAGITEYSRTLAVTSQIHLHC